MTPRFTSEDESGFVLLPEGFKEYLFNFSSPLIYTTTLPEAHAASAVDLLQMVSERNDLREHLGKISLLMKESLRQDGFRVTGDAHILSVKIGDEEKTVAVAKGLLNNSIFVLPARFPTVPLRRAILRISMTALHTEEDVARFLSKIKEIIS